MGQDQRRRERPSEKQASAKLTRSRRSAPVSNQVIDPDPFGIAVGVIAALAGVAQIVSVAHQLWSTPKDGLHTRASPFIEMLADELNRSVRLIEKIERHLRELATLDNRPVLEAPIAFGAAPMMIPVRSFGRHDQLIQELTWVIASLNKATLAIIRHDPNFAQKLGVEVMASFQDINERINALQKGSIGEALYETMFMMREMERIVHRLRDVN